MEEAQEVIAIPSESQEPSKFQFPKFEFVVEDYFPTEEIHLIGGPSGAGKSTWTLKFIDNWRQGNSFFGKKAYPMPFIYLSFDRSQMSVYRTFNRMQLDPRNFNIVVPKKKDRTAPLRLILSNITAAKPEIKVFFIEGFATKVPEGQINNQKILADWLVDLQDLCQEKHITIFGIVHMAKTKEDDKYANPRQRISGSIAWGGYSETIILIEPKNPNRPEDSTRELCILPRNAPEERRTFGFQNGLLVETNAPQNNREKFLLWYQTHGPNDEVTTEEMILKTGLSRSSLALELQKMMDQKQIEKIKTGHYRIVGPAETADA